MTLNKVSISINHLIKSRVKARRKEIKTMQEFIKLVPSLEEITLLNLVTIDAKFVQYGKKDAIYTAQGAVWGVNVTLNKGLDNECIIHVKRIADVTPLSNPCDTFNSVNRLKGLPCLLKILAYYGFGYLDDIALIAEIYRSEFTENKTFEDGETGYSYPNHQDEIKAYYDESRVYYDELEDDDNDHLVEWEDEKRYRETYEGIYE